MEARISSTEYRRLLGQKKKAALAHAHRTQALRKRLAAVILEDPVRALEAATTTLSNKKAPQQQWSRRQWEELLRTRTMKDIAKLLVRPPEKFQPLMDCHPFGGLASAVHGR
ncbi:MAG: hypothetical protein BGO12_10030 [Verrucomicrobia bacterium 61-8]|jgi:hypothetical protein|nr:hypothetical protein [Verrucomicrobiota bacterium]OJV03537.1 MAG: hypothetical protein BGO12_10030 [Verrucomicrobia bacterium 61-8]